MVTENRSDDFVEYVNSEIKVLRERGGSAGKISDGHHTFDELYEHRNTLFCALMRFNVEKNGYSNWYSWREVSKDGKYFLAGMCNAATDSQISYHLPIKFWDQLRNVQEYDTPPVEYNGHTPQDVVAYLSLL